MDNCQHVLLRCCANLLDFYTRLNVRDRIVNRYAYLGFDSIDPADLRGRFRWWGLYTQRRPA